MADKFDISTVKNMDIKSVLATVKVLQGEIGDLMIDKNMSKLKDLKSVGKKRKDLARTLTVLTQKRMLEKLEKQEKGGGA